MFVVPATLLFVYGFFLYLHSIHTHYLLSTPSLHPYLHPPSASKLLSSANATPPPSGLSRLLINRRLQNLAYFGAILLAATHATIELVLWDGAWSSMTPLQHSTMYFLVILCAFIGLGMDLNILPYTARYSVGICFWLCGFMFYAHAQQGLYNESIHKMVSMIFWAAGSVYIVYSALLAACYNTAAAALNSPSPTLISPVLLSFTSTASRLTSLFVMLAGSWLFHIAFALFSPFAQGDIVHPDHDAHTLYLELSWHFLFLTTLALFLEGAFRWQHGDWPRAEERRLGAGRVRYDKVGGKDGLEEEGGSSRFTVDGEDEDDGRGVGMNGKHGGVKTKAKVRSKAGGDSRNGHKLGDEHAVDEQEKEAMDML